MSAIDDQSAQAAIGLDEARAFIWAEAELLDRLAYREWVKLWTDTGLYIIPIERGDNDPLDDLNIAYDGPEMREARVKRLLSGFSMSSSPPARTIRTNSRFVVASTEPGMIDLRCAQVLVEYKYTRTRVLAADVSFRIVRNGDKLLLDRKVVQLINSDSDQFGMGYLL